MSAIAYGIDFGTSNSAISIAYPDESVLVPLGDRGADVLPSIIYLDRSRQRLAGERAVRQYLVAGSLRDTRLMSSIKTFLADASWTGTEAPWGAHLTPEELVAIVLTELKREADKVTGQNVRRAVLGHPVLFAGVSGGGWQQQQDLAKARLADAARIAGFTELVFANEPEAALAAEYERDGIIVGLDFGGGTFDVSVVEVSDGRRTLLATHGAAIGGERFDSLLFEGIMAEPLGLKRTYRSRGKRLPIPAYLGKFGTLHGALTMVGDPRTRKILDDFLAADDGEQLRTLENIVYGGHGYAFYRALEVAKIDLSSFDESSVLLHRPGVVIDESIERDEFERLIRPDLKRIDAVIEQALADANVGARDVTAVVRTGGSSQIPAFIELADQRFGAERVQERDALATVAIGLGLIALEHFG